MRELKIKKTQLICVGSIIIQILPSQITKYWPEINSHIDQLMYYMKYLGSFALLAYVLSGPRNQIIKKRSEKYFRILLPLLILFVFVEAIALFYSPVVSSYGIRYWTRFLAYLLDKVCILITIYCLYQIGKENTMKYISTALIIDGFFTLSVAVLQTGIIDTIKVFFAVFGIVESEALEILEAQELTYCIGLCLVYYMFISKTSKNKVRILLLALFFILGGKRIAFAGLAVSGVFLLFVRKKGLSKLVIAIVGVIGVGISIGWIALLYNGDAMLLFSKYGINVMGRDAIYSYFISRSTFSVSNIGWGFAATSKAIENMTRAEVGNMVNVRGLHNDILKMYIDCGFIGSICWYGFNLLYMPLSLFEKFGKKNATLYIAIIIFTFINYMTSNVETCFVYQTILLLIPLVQVDNKQ